MAAFCVLQQEVHLAENSMTRVKVIALLELIDDIVSDDRPFAEKARYVQSIANDSSDSGISLNEFVSWFSDHG